jgi:aryl-alcohol dehydrogenase-like predicted oxidoreductase
MHRVRLGASGLDVSSICYGSWQVSPRVWGEQPKEIFISAMRRAFEVGVNFYDTADAYTRGLSETILGEALEDLPREEIVVATKVGVRFDTPVRHGDISKEHILASCDNSLKRLRTDYIDLYQCHEFDSSTDLAETAEAMEKLKKAGKIRAYGLSNFTVEQIRLARKYGNFTTLQPSYNLIHNEAEKDLLPCCKVEGMGVLTYSSLCYGLLTGRFKGVETFTDLRSRSDDFRGDRFKELAGKVALLKPMAEKYGMTITQLALTVTLQNPMIDCAIVGIKRPEQIEEAAGAMGRTVSREDFHVVRRTLGSD